MKQMLTATLIAVLLAAALPTLAQEATPEPLPSNTPPPTYTPYPTYTPLPTYTPPPTYTPLPTYTPYPSLTPTLTVTPTPTSSIPPFDVLANCEEFDQEGGTTSAGTPVRIFWGWVVTEPQYLVQHLEHGVYDVRLDGAQLTDYDDFREPLRWHPADGGWGVYWYVPVNFLEVGEHHVTYAITWSRAISDGWVKFGPGTLTETIASGCTFTVQ
jgi:hypothetical protein